MHGFEQIQPSNRMYFLDKSSLLKHHLSPNRVGGKSKSKQGHLSDGEEERRIHGGNMVINTSHLPVGNAIRTNLSTITHKKQKR